MNRIIFENLCTCANAMDIANCLIHNNPSRSLARTQATCVVLMQILLARVLEIVVLSRFVFKNKVLNCEYNSACILLSSMGKQKKVL